MYTPEPTRRDLRLGLCLNPRVLTCTELLLLENILPLLTSSHSVTFYGVYTVKRTKISSSTSRSYI